MVVAILPTPVSYEQSLDLTQSDRILCYSSNAESYRLFLGKSFMQTDTGVLEHNTGRYIQHENAASLVSCSADSPADVTHPPKPDFGSRDSLSNLVKNKYPHEHPPELELNPKKALDPANPDPINELTNKIHHGDAKEVLKSFPSDSCHGWITSPPYYEARDYGVDGQLGHEETVTEYIESLLTIINELMRVIRDDGVGCIIIDDVYRDGSLIGVPQKLHQEITNQGYEVIHHSPWTKPNGKPEAVNNRYTHSHEHILMIAHEGGNHYFDKQSAEDPGDVFDISVGSTDTDHDAVFPVELPKQLIKTTIPTKVCPKCGAPFEKEYEVTDIRNLDTSRPQAKRALELAEKHDLTDEQLRAVRSIGLGNIGQAKRTQDGTGKNANKTEKLAAEAEDALGSYSREFTSPKKEHTGFTHSCNCDINDESEVSGIVIDPFLGSGTTAVAAKQLRRQWIGIELNEEYIATAESRIGVNVSDPSKLRDNDQGSITDFF